MSKFRKSKRPEIPGLSTASLSDLVFTLLFFFIILSNISDETRNVKVKFEEPVATEYNSSDKQVPYIYIYAGQSIDASQQENQTNTVVQVNDRIVAVPELKAHFLQLKAGFPTAEQIRIVASVRADKDTPMQVIRDIENALREAKILKVNYAVRNTTIHQER
ncbi:MAG: biopolymer transporter ExbD [Dysgonamonadaceae bacterium]|jgi:biopolymer transport protein ExbD|nr:biopolymer transporter ExbD [Dysgonamonadaceae bacterium]